MKKGQSYKSEPYESMGHFTDQNGKLRKDTSASLFESMLRSEAYQDLSFRERALYTVCKAQKYGKRKPERDFEDVEEVQGDDCFYLNWSQVIQYGIYAKNNHAWFYRDMKTLIDHGFIERISSGKAHHEKSIYRYVSAWQNWHREN